jgi:hypothetical protein
MGQKAKHTSLIPRDVGLLFGDLAADVDRFRKTT